MDKNSSTNCLNEQRKRELDTLLENISFKPDANGLEIGSGNCYQSNFLKKKFSFLISTEYDKNAIDKKNLKDILFLLCDAQNLCFKKNKFNVIYSSNVFEHIPNKHEALKEMTRVLKDDGVMIHIMPSRTWKILNFFGHYLNLLRSVIIMLILKKEKPPEKTINKKENVEEKKKIMRFFIPPIHGTYKTHFEEYICFGKNRWIVFFEKNNMKIEKIIKMPLYSGYMFGFERLRRSGEFLGFSSSYAYFVSKTIKKSSK
ncbi:MAG: class I SAM-dependent methyltransferase [Candidatus Aenigmarchaeota archaeon]|nr:class I SAM-dependent methyltransferase [Candidatus Aenigmarchaeota archaeon]